MRQQFERIITNEPSYPRSHIDIEVPIQCSVRLRAEKAEIGVFKSDVNDQKNLNVVFEIEPPGHPYKIVSGI